MFKRRTFILAVWLVLPVTAAQAQSSTPGLSPPPIQHPQIQPPSIPQYGALPTTNLNPLPQNSFSDRATQCLQLGAAAGLSSGSNGMFAAGC